MAGGVKSSQSVEPYFDDILQRDHPRHHPAVARQRMLRSVVRDVLVGLKAHERVLVNSTGRPPPRALPALDFAVRQELGTSTNCSNVIQHVETIIVS